MGILQSINERLRGAVWNWLTEGQANMLLDENERETQSLVVTCRDYYDGKHDVKLTDRQKKYLEQHGNGVKFTVNQCPVIIDAAVERLQVISFDVPGEAEEDEEEGVGALLWQWWQQNRMDAVQTEAHRRAIRDRDAYVLVDYDEATKRPRFTLHQRFVDPIVKGGDGYGMWIDYPNDDPFLEPIRAVKQWSEKDAEGKTRVRRTVYYPDRVEKYVRKGREWQEFRENEGDAWPIPWKTADGKPLGIPVAHLRTPGFILKDALPLQDALNKTWLDILGGADTTAFRMLVTLGFIPTTDGKAPNSDSSNLLKILPGQMLGTMKPAGQADVRSIDPASLQPLLETEERIVLRMANTTRTPVGRFITSKQIAGAETQKQQDTPLLGRLRENMTLFGNAWEDMCHIALRLERAFGQRKDLDAEVLVSTVWERPEVRDEKTHMEELQMKQGLGVDDPQLWTEMGYDEAKQTRFMRAKLKSEALTMRIAARNLPSAEEEVANGLASAA